MSDMKWNGNNTSEGLLGRSLYSIIPIHSNHSNLIKVVNSGHGCLITHSRLIGFNFRNSSLIGANLRV